MYCGVKIPYLELWIKRAISKYENKKGLDHLVRSLPDQVFVCLHEINGPVNTISVMFSHLEEKGSKTEWDR